MADNHQKKQTRRGPGLNRLIQQALDRRLAERDRSPVGRRAVSPPPRREEAPSAEQAVRWANDWRQRCTVSGERWLRCLDLWI